MSRPGCAPTFVNGTARPASRGPMRRRWSLEVIGAHPGSNRSLVVQASRREELVGLKIELCDTGQAGTLRALDGAAIGPGLLDVDPERGAMLMRWVVGRPLQVADPENLPRTRGLAVALAAVNTQPGVAPAPHSGAAMEQGVSLALRHLDRLGETPYRPDLLHEDRDGALSSSAFMSIGGRPKRTPRALAEAMPASMRSRMRSRS